MLASLASSLTQRHIGHVQRADGACLGGAEVRPSEVRGDARRGRQAGLTGEDEQARWEAPVVCEGDIIKLGYCGGDVRERSKMRELAKVEIFGESLYRKQCDSDETILDADDCGREVRL